MAIDQEQIRKQAKQIMDEFKEALDQVNDEGGNIGFEMGTGVREEGEKEQDPEFKERMLKNAPKVKGECILAEKKKW